MTLENVTDTINKLRLKHILRRRKNIHLLPNADKVIIGSHDIEYDGWVCSDVDILDITQHVDFSKYWPENSRKVFLAEHVWEHLDIETGRLALKNCFTFLKSGGHIRIAVPDGYFPNESYIEYVRPKQSKKGLHDHKVLYTYQTLSQLLISVGFEVRLLEYWDENGQFHAHQWSSSDGHIRRSLNHDNRNKNGQINYTSLIVDGIKSTNNNEEKQV